MAVVPAGPSAGWALRRRLGLVFGVLGVVAAVLIAAVVVSTVFFVHAGNAVIYRWQPAVINVERLQVDLLDQETGLRGYVLSRDDAFLAPYRDARASQTSHVTRLRQLAEGDDVLRTRIDAVLAAADAWRRTYVTPSIAAVHDDPATATRRVESDGAKAAFDLIRTRLTSLSDEVVARTLSARNERTAAGVVFIIALSLAAAVVIGAVFLLWRGLRRWVLLPVEGLATQTRVVAAGETHHEIAVSGPDELVNLGSDVEAMRRRIADQLLRAEQIQDELRRQGAELERSNQDLQQFAYVASHDLSEPLRKVANFCQLLERQYAEQLDDRARQYIDFAVDGAKRMQALITDLLSLSRVGRTTEEFVPVDLGGVAQQAVRTLADRIGAAGATVEFDGPLPTVPGDRTLLVSLFENLIGNAVKYRRPDVAPIVTVRARPGDPTPEGHPTWAISVADNGIGIEGQYAERIFAVFQRLHLRDQYDGTGIGLALCRRIVEFHGGHIRLSPVQSADHGATFEFTLPTRGGSGAESRD